MNRKLLVFAAILALALFWSRFGPESAPPHVKAIAPPPAPSLASAADNPDPPASPVKLIFIHHSCGGNWLADIGEHDQAGGLGQALMADSYFVSATNYGWGPDAIGSNTDIPNWPDWFTGSNSSTYLNALYNEFGQNICGEGMCFGDWTRMADPEPSRENEIIMFKSCYPNSDLYGNPDDPPLAEPNDQYTVANAKAVYNDILTYFETRQDKLFIIVTAPPLAEGETSADRATNARAFNDWLVNNWLAGYAYNNVAVFDFYNVLTSNGGDINTNDLGEETGNHHRWWNGAVQHIQTVSNNFSAYPVGDSHPTGAGNIKATAEFVPLLNIYYNRWKSGGAPAPTLNLTAPAGGETWIVDSQHQIQWTTTGSVAQVNLSYSTDGFSTSHSIASAIANTGSHNWTIPNDPSASAQVRVESVVSPTTVYDVSASFTIQESGGVTDTYTLNAVITPTNATPPVTYNWSPEPASGQGTATVTYQWAAGSHQVALQVTNCGGTFTAQRTFNVSRVSPTPSRSPEGVSANKPAQETMIFQDGVSPSAGYAGTTDVILAADADANANLGGLENLEVFYGDSENRRTLIRWDISALPSDITIQAARVELYRYEAGATNDMEIALYRVTREWVEGSGHDLSPGSTYDPDGATWLTATTGIPWTTPGGDYNATAIDQITLPTGMSNGWIQLEATEAVQAWVAGSASNYGLLLRPVSGDYTYHYFHSREGATANLRPRLVVTYTTGVTPPPTPSLTLTTPTGSTTWPISSAQQIRWNTEPAGSVTQVNLYYSIAGVTTTIETGVTNNNVYDWTTPPTATTSARVRVESAVSPTTVYDVSDNFTLSDTAVATSTIFLPLVVKNYPVPTTCPYPLTGVAISGPGTTSIPSGDLVQQDDLVYRGAFRLPDDADAPRTFEYGGNAMSFNPDGHITNTDQYAGSLFITGHDRTDAYTDGSQIAEVTIPAPVISDNLDDLPYAAFLQGFHDVTAGYFQELSTVPKIGIQYLNHPDTGPKIHLTWGRHLQQLEDYLPSQAWINADLANPDLQGVWFIGNQNPNSVNGYMFDIPAAWADTHAQGRYLATGRFHPGGLGGMGPTLLAYRPWLEGGAAPISGTHLAETTLLRYQSSLTNSTITRCMENYQHADGWEGGAWITTPSGKSAVLFAGTKATGTKSWYGYIHPTNNPALPCVDMEVIGDFWPCRLADGSDCPATDVVHCCDEGVDCISARAWWSTRHDARFVLYNPADLAQVAAGTMESWQPQPYTTIDVDEHLYFNPPTWDEFELGWGDQRRDRLGAAAYDHDNAFLYVLELSGDGAKPVVHVWEVR